MMTKCFRTLRALTVWLCIAAGLTSCHDDHKHTLYATSSEHTLLVYMAGDNSLNSYVTNNIYAMMSGLQQCDVPLNLIIYHDNRTATDKLPVLFQLRKRADSNKVDTLWLKSWSEDVDSTDPEWMAKVIRTTFERFDSPVKGLEVWGHGLSWIPSSTFVADAAPARAMEWVGQDDSDFGELWELRQCIEASGVHFDYMMFDACHMASAEVACELSGVTDHILASSTEIMGNGFPYADMIRSLSTIQNADEVEAGLTSALLDYQNAYADNGTFSLIRTKGISQLLDVCRRLEEQATPVLSLWAEAPATYEARVQHYGRVSRKARYYFYDVRQWAELLAESAGGCDLAAFDEALGQCVPAHYFSQRFTDGDELLRIGSSCGLMMSVPQFWSLSGNDMLDAAYTKLQWQL